MKTKQKTAKEYAAGLEDRLRMMGISPDNPSFPGICLMLKDAFLDGVKWMEDNSIPLYEKKALTLDEAARYLNISKSSLYKLTHKKQIPFNQPGGKVIFFRRTDLDNWALNHN